MKKTILIIEDDEYIRDSLAELLETEGYTVNVAFNGEEGMNALRTQGKPSLILLDLMMPIKDGFQFREEQLQDPSFSQIPVVIMSAHGNIKENRERTGALAYLKKPIDIDEVLKTVEKYVS